MTPMRSPQTEGKRIVVRRLANTERKVQERKTMRKSMIVMSCVKSQGR